jgi:hypothetical protein
VEVDQEGEVGNGKHTGLPLQLQQLWEILYKEVVWLHGIWRVYKQLFTHSPERLDLLNECAGTFFYMVQRTFVLEVLMTLSKLADPAATGRKNNLTLRTLMSRIEELKEDRLSKRLRPVLRQYLSAYEKIHDLRNKTLAHYDYDTRINAADDPILGPSRLEIEEMLKLLTTFMNEIDYHFKRHTTAFQEFPIQDGDYIVEYLKQSKRYRQLMDDGRIPYHDLEKSDLFEV